MILSVFALPKMGSTASKQSPSTAGPSSRIVSLSNLLGNAYICFLVLSFSSQFHHSALRCLRWIWLNADSPTLKGQSRSNYTIRRRLLAPLQSSQSEWIEYSSGWRAMRREMEMEGVVLCVLSLDWKKSAKERSLQHLPEVSRSDPLPRRTYSCSRDVWPESIPQRLTKRSTFAVSAPYRLNDHTASAQRPKMLSKKWCTYGYPTLPKGTDMSDFETHHHTGAPPTYISSQISP